MKTQQTLTKKQFNKLSQRDKRVAIAKDVLLQLRAEKYISTSGTYVEMYNFDNQHIINDYAPAKEAINHPGTFCHVCAKGAALLSFTRITNDREVHHISYRVSQNEDMIAIFGKNMWDEMEEMFEGSRLSNRTARMENVMNNIIKNKGLLKVGRMLIG